MRYCMQIRRRITIPQGVSISTEVLSAAMISRATSPRLLDGCSEKVLRGRFARAFCECGVSRSPVLRLLKQSQPCHGTVEKMEAGSPSGQIRGRRGMATTYHKNNPKSMSCVPFSFFLDVSSLTFLHANSENLQTPPESVQRTRALSLQQVTPAVPADVCTPDPALFFAGFPILHRLTLNAAVPLDSQMNSAKLSKRKRIHESRIVFRIADGISPSSSGRESENDSRTAR